MQKLTRVSNYDIWYLDNFYDDPDQVREYALSLNYSRSNSDLFPGVRSGLTEEFYSYFLRLFEDKISLNHPFELWYKFKPYWFLIIVFLFNVLILVFIVF